VDNFDHRGQRAYEGSALAVLYNVFVRKCQLRAGVLVICNKRNSAITKYVSIWTHERHNGGR